MWALAWWVKVIGLLLVVCGVVVVLVGGRVVPAVVACCTPPLPQRLSRRFGWRRGEWRRT